MIVAMPIVLRQMVYSRIASSHTPPLSDNEWERSGSRGWEHRPETRLQYDASRGPWYVFFPIVSQRWIYVAKLNGKKCGQMRSSAYRHNWLDQLTTIVLIMIIICTKFMSRIQITYTFSKPKLAFSVVSRVFNSNSLINRRRLVYPTVYLQFLLEVWSVD